MCFTNGTSAPCYYLCFFLDSLNNVVKQLLLDARITIVFGWIIVWGTQTTRSSSSLCFMLFFHAYTPWYDSSFHISRIYHCCTLSSTMHPCLFPLLLPLPNFDTNHLNQPCVIQILLIGSVAVDSQQDVDDSYRIIHVTTYNLFLFSLVVYSSVVWLTKGFIYSSFQG